jgi:hypothetical protein
MVRRGWADGHGLAGHSSTLKQPSQLQQCQITWCTLQVSAMDVNGDAKQQLWLGCARHQGRSLAVCTHTHLASPCCRRAVCRMPTAQ